MTDIQQIIDDLKKNWSIPRKGIHRSEETFFEFVCFFSKGVMLPENYPFEIPKNLKDFWTIAGEANLFLDKEYGQWGLKIFSPEDSLQITEEENLFRPNVYASNDLIFGGFIGDSDKLVIDCGVEFFGRVLVSQPIDPRSDWTIVADSFVDFLLKYVDKDGEKFWEY